MTVFHQIEKWLCSTELRNDCVPLNWEMTVLHSNNIGVISSKFINKFVQKWQCYYTLSDQSIPLVTVTSVVSLLTEQLWFHLQKKQRYNYSDVTTYCFSFISKVTLFWDFFECRNYYFLHIVFDVVWSGGKFKL